MKMIEQRKNQIFMMLSKTNNTCKSHLVRKGVTEEEISKLLENNDIAISGCTTEDSVFPSEPKYIIC